MRWKILGFALIVIATVSAVFIGYLSAGNNVKNEENIVAETGTVVFLDFEGGFYGIIGDGGERYDSLNLDQEFEVDGLRVYFEAKILHDVATFHMWGTPVSLVKLQRLE